MARKTSSNSRHQQPSSVSLSMFASGLAVFFLLAVTSSPSSKKSTMMVGANAAVPQQHGTVDEEYVLDSREYKLNSEEYVPDYINFDQQQSHDADGQLGDGHTRLPEHGRLTCTTDCTSIPKVCLWGALRTCDFLPECPVCLGFWCGKCTRRKVPAKPMLDDISTLETSRTI